MIEASTGDTNESQRADCFTRKRVCRHDEKLGFLAKRLCSDGASNLRRTQTLTTAPHLVVGHVRRDERGRQALHADGGVLAQN